jgi:hypothetical protein
MSCSKRLVLLIFTRRLDMLMTSKYSVEAVAKNFLQGNYGLDMAAMAGTLEETAAASPSDAESG